MSASASVRHETGREIDGPLTFPRDVLAYAGLRAASEQKTGLSYSIWREAQGGCYLLPDRGESGARRGGGATLHGFTTAFPQLAHPLRFPWRLAAHDRLWLDANSVHDLVRAMGGTASGASPPAFHVAVPGAYRKITVVRTDSDHRPIMFGKMAAHPGAESRLRAEAGVLSRLGRTPAIRSRVPGCAGLADWGGGRVLLLSAGPPNPGGRRFGALHREFLELLHRETSRDTLFGESRTAVRWRAWLDDQTGRECGSSAAQLRAAMLELLERLGPVQMPLCLAHGDFTPSNTRRGPDGLFVFDWETAFDAATPGFDAFHFHALPRMLRGRELQRPPSIAAWVSSLWPSAERHMGDLWTAYLVETGVQYALARAERPEEGDDRVLRAIASALAAESGRRPPTV